MKKIVILLVTGLLLGLSHQASAEQLDAIIACDNEYKLYVNGTQIGQGAEWTQAQAYSVSLPPGENLIAVEGIDRGGTAGLLAEFKVDGTTIVTDSTWRCSTSWQTGWDGLGFDDSSWNLAQEYYSFGEGPWGPCVGDMPTDTQAKWIWSNDAERHNRVYFRKTFTVGVINQPPIAQPSADPTSGEAPLTVQFTGSGTDPDGTIVAYHWDFADGQTSDEQNPSHTYQNPGVYKAILTVTDDDGATGSDNVEITVIKLTVEIPQLLRFVGRLGDAEETSLNGTFTLTFRLYDSEQGGQPLWQEVQQVNVKKGLLDVELGAQTALALPFNIQYWLGVEVESDGEMVPRFKLTTVPYSFRSER